MQQIPVPARRRVLLPTAGYADSPTEIVTRHVYVRTERQPDPEFGVLRPQWAFIFKCEETDAERVYGVQDATLCTDDLVKSEGLKC